MDNNLYRLDLKQDLDVLGEDLDAYIYSGVTLQKSLFTFERGG